MGKNQQHAARQEARKSRMEVVDDETGGTHDVDASFHTAEWHAARLAALQVERPSWEEWQKKRRVQEAREQEEDDMQETLMREYKASLEKDRAERLGYRHSKDGESRDRKQRRKDRKHRRERKRSEGKEKGKSHGRSKRKDRDY